MYLIRRLLYLPVSLFLLSMVCFFLRGLIPGDPVAASLPAADSRLATSSPTAYNALYQRAAKRLGRDLPGFYFSIRNAILPDTLHRITRPEEQRMLRALTLDAGKWEGVSAYYEALLKTAYPPPTTDRPPAESTVARRLLVRDDPAKIAESLQRLERAGEAPELVSSYREIQSDKGRSALLLPTIRWHGTNNQYHQWLSDLITGELGNSYLDGQPVKQKIGRALPWTLLLNFLTVTIVFSISVPLGLYLAGKAGSRTDHATTLLLFLFFGIPTFWVATLLANFLTTPAFGMDFFPSMGVGQVAEGSSLLTILYARGSHLFLPVMCLAYPAFAYVTRHLRQATLAELEKPYVDTARMKGLSERSIRWRHVFRNASFPLITIFGGLFPQLLAGSVVVERIFNLPGMGQLLYVSATNGDWPVVIILVLLNGVLTATGLLAADLLYSLLDPRVSLTRPSQRQTFVT